MAMVELLFALVRQCWVHRGEVSKADAARAALPFTVLANLMLRPFRAPTVRRAYLPASLLCRTMLAFDRSEQGQIFREILQRGRYFR
eukprot:COSAG06_NODE_1561_length_9104_cov_25.044309_3_plen_87_part_00